MKLEQSFTVTVPVEQVWATLADLERVGPCLPGGAITGREPDGSFKGTFAIAVDPTPAVYDGTLKLESLDEEGRVATMNARGLARGGEGAASATIVSTASHEGEQTPVHVVVELAVTSDAEAQVTEAVRQLFVDDFARRLEAALQAQATAAEPVATEPAAEPVATEPAAEPVGAEPEPEPAAAEPAPPVAAAPPPMPEPPPPPRRTGSIPPPGAAPATPPTPAKPSLGDRLKGLLASLRRRKDG